MKKDNNKEIKTEWDLTPLLLKDDPDFQNYLIKLEGDYRNFINRWKPRRDYLENPEILKEALDELEKLLREFSGGGKAGYYYSLKNQQDQDDIEIKARLAKIQDRLIKLGNEVQFFPLNISKIPEINQDKFLKHPDLIHYRNYLKNSFREARHLLSDEEEKIMNIKSVTSHEKWVDMVDRLFSKELRQIEIKGTEEEKNFWELMSLTSSADKKTRDGAARLVNEVISKNIAIAEEEINAIITDKRNNDELRKFSRPDEARHLGDDIETNIVDSMIKAVANSFDVARDYYRLKAGLLGVKKLEYHERNVPYGNIDKEYSYNDSVKLIYEVFKNLDEDFSEIFKRFTDEGNMDVFPRKGKAGGAFCIHLGKNLPTYIMLNHTNRLQDALTIAHESGHGINNELIRAKQNAINFGTPTSTAEVASTFMEDFVIERLISEADDELRLALMMMKLNEDVSTIFRQAACYGFEAELHKTHREKGYLSKEEIGAIFKKHMSAYMGDFVSQDEGSENWWAYWSHIRRFFYVYSYASGLLISKYMQKQVRKDKKFISKVKEFLSTGTSESPKNIFKKMGIDITDDKFWDDSISEVRQLLEETEKLARKMGKIK